MSQNVIYLHGKPDPVAHYLRLGTLHRQIETLLGSGRMPLDRVVVEASAFSRQRDVITLLAESGRELNLDTNVAELSAIGRCSGATTTRGPNRSVCLEEAVIACLRL